MANIVSEISNFRGLTDVIYDNGTYVIYGCGIPKIIPPTSYNVTNLPQFNEIKVVSTHGEVKLTTWYMSICRSAAGGGTPVTYPYFETYINDIRVTPNDTYPDAGFTYVRLIQSDVSVGEAYIDAIQPWKYNRFENLETEPPNINLLWDDIHAKNSIYTGKIRFYHLYDRNNNVAISRWPFSTMYSKLKSAFTDFINGTVYQNKLKAVSHTNVWRCIGTLMPASTKTYINSTWSTSKTWYIKVDFKQKGSNVVNYVPMLRDKYLLIKIII